MIVLLIVFDFLNFLIKKFDFLNVILIVVNIIVKLFVVLIIFVFLVIIVVSLLWGSFDFEKIGSFCLWISVFNLLMDEIFVWINLDG